VKLIFQKANQEAIVHLKQQSKKEKPTKLSTTPTLS